jgi:iron complex outermembrane recepter protein
VPGVSGEADWYQEDSKSYAIFTNETYNIAQGLDLTAGLRFTEDKKTADSNYVSPDRGAACGALLENPAVVGNLATNPRRSISGRAGLRDAVQPGLCRPIDEPVLERGQRHGYGQVVVSLQ